MSSENEYSIINEISGAKGYSIALFTTFNFEIPFFERGVLPLLLDNGIRSIHLFVDGDNFREAIKTSESRNLGKKYIVSPIEMRGAFHPKLVLLLGDNRAKLIIGSGNITVHGYTYNSEVFQSFDWPQGNDTYFSIINSAITFLLNLYESTYKLDDGLFDSIRMLPYYAEKPVTGIPALVHNMNTSILSQIRNYIQEDISEIDIAVPYYDNQLRALQRLRDAFPNSRIRLFIQNGKSTFSKDSDSIPDLTEIVVFKGVKSLNASMHFYHGKVFRFHANGKEYFLFGSANCTESAFCKTQSENGNVECDVLLTGVEGDFQYIFDDFIEDTEKPLTCTSMFYQTPDSSNYLYKYGKLAVNLELHLGFTKKPILHAVTINDTVADFEVTDNEIIVRPSLDTVFMLDGRSVFSVGLIDSEGNVETVLGWYFSILEIEECRSYSRTFDWRKIILDDDDEDEEAYREFIIQFLEANTVAEIEREKMFRQQVKEIEIEQENANETDSEIYVDIQIPSEILMKIRHFDSINRIKIQIKEDFIKKLEEGERSYHNRISKSADVINNPVIRFVESSTRDAFVRFVKKHIKAQIEVFENGFDYNNILAEYLVIRNCYSRFSEKNIFEETYMVNSKASLLFCLLNNLPIEMEEKDKKLVPELVLMCVLENKMCSDAEAVSSDTIKNLNVRLIRKLNELFDIRDRYGIFLPAVLGSSETIQCGYVYAKDYIESLFDSKSLNGLKNYIIDLYPDGEISLDNNTMIVEIRVPDAGKHLMINKGMLSEINKYKRTQPGIRQLKVIVRSQEKATLRKLENVFSWSTHKCTVTYFYNNGKEYSESRFWNI